MRIIKQVLKQVNIENKQYPVHIIYKSGKKNISYRFRNDEFIITAPILARYQTIEEGLFKFAPRLMSYSGKPKLWGENYIYILGNKYQLTPTSIKIDSEHEISFKDIDSFKRKLKKWFKSIVEEQVIFYKGQMNITKSLNVRIKEMKSRYGSYSRQTESLSFGFELVHYDIEMTKAVVVHELSHFYVFDHSKKFYNLVLKNYPNYMEVHGKLRKGIVK